MSSRPGAGPADRGARPWSGGEREQEVAMVFASGGTGTAFAQLGGGCSDCRCITQPNPKSRASEGGRMKHVCALFLSIPDTPTPRSSARRPARTAHARPGDERYPADAWPRSLQNNASPARSGMRRAQHAPRRLDEDLSAVGAAASLCHETRLRGRSGGESFVQLLLSQWAADQMGPDAPVSSSTAAFVRG
ncbi:uncharacterized protein K452DRAFT_312994 [Aplosporella prunicola CBS 121167]|uniref:Uncharacterized protein n=1 Tax=Aplosporella prunicola CBS 121167 TaxID=1176127 RepID=A0A6A6AZK7_9PEZI|nr:uncharacterized protein K452DRAFT_312994 [Aplosporella prunicola CBS 121167]KAF2136623.1 hypothetical protein K452DRAFT_312994 [Aplosporella prunicola CBS 121167]